VEQHGAQRRQIMEPHIGGLECPVERQGIGNRQRIFIQRERLGRLPARTLDRPMCPGDSVNSTTPPGFSTQRNLVIALY
jgi:hypothetical protein